MGAASWVAYVAVAGLALLAMRHTANKTLDAILVRVAAVCGLGAGLVGATGWIGQAVTWCVGAITGAGDTLGAAAVGASVVWVMGAVLGVLWVLAMIPDKWATYDAPDWLLGSALILPAMLATVPGSLGEGLRALLDGGGQAATAIVSGLVA